MRQIVLNGKPEPTQTPVEKVVAAFGEGGAAEIAGVSIDAVRKWRRRKDTGGGGGLVPSYYQAKFLAASDAQAKGLTAADFIAEPVL